MTIINEVLDIPHYLLGDMSTSFQQRTGEVLIEVIILCIIITIEFVLITKLYRRIKILEGFLSICASCKKVRHENNWEHIEKYISDHSLAQFSHSICPDCGKKLYPEFYGQKQ